MDAAAALEMWGRSLSYNMQYETFVSDGDSSALLAVCAMNEGKGPYGDECKVQKIECKSRGKATWNWLERPQKGEKCWKTENIFN